MLFFLFNERYVILYGFQIGVIKLAISCKSARKGPKCNFENKKLGIV